MTIRAWAEKYLGDNGMFPDQAVAVVKATEEHKANEAMKGRWEHDIEGYPAPLLAVLRMSLNASAVEWIDANCPAAWFRPMFAPEAK